MFVKNLGTNFKEVTKYFGIPDLWIAIALNPGLYAGLRDFTSYCLNKPGYRIVQFSQ